MTLRFREKCMRIRKNQRLEKKLRVIDYRRKPKSGDGPSNAASEHGGGRSDKRLRLEPEEIPNKLTSNEIDGFKALVQQGADVVVPRREDPDQNWVEKESQVKKQHISVIIAAIVGLICISGALLYFGLQKKAASATDEEQQNQMVGMYGVEERNLEQAFSEIEEVVTSYLMADTWEKRQKFMRPSPNLLEKIARYETAHERYLVAHSVDSIKPLELPPGLDRSWVVGVAASSKQGQSSVLYCIKARDEWQVDWEASIAYNDFDFNEVDEIREGTRMRVRAGFTKDQLYLSDFPEEKYLSLRIVFPNKETGFYGFVKRGSKQSSWIESTLAISGNDDKRMLLLAEIEFKYKLTDRWVVEVTQLINSNWVAPEGLAKSKVPKADFDSQLTP